MTVTHHDRNGKAWRFGVNCTPYQMLLFRRMVAAVRQVGQREQLSLAYLADADNNTAFCSEVEGVVLSALSEHYPAEGVPPRPPQAPDVANVARSAPLATANEQPASNEPTDETEEPEPYYWQRF